MLNRVRVNEKGSPREAGAVPILVLIAAIGLISFLAVSSSAPLKNKVLDQLFPKPASHAVSGPTSGPITPSPFPTASPSATPAPTPAPDVTPPAVNITSPLNGSTVKKSSTVNITANASDNKGVAKVEFYVAGSLKCTDTTIPYSCSWSVPKAPRVTYSIQAKAYDSSNNSAQHSISVTSK